MQYANKPTAFDIVVLYSEQNFINVSHEKIGIKIEIAIRIELDQKYYTLV